MYVINYLWDFQFLNPLPPRFVCVYVCYSMCNSKKNASKTHILGSFENIPFFKRLSYFPKQFWIKFQQKRLCASRFMDANVNQRPLKANIFILFTQYLIKSPLFLMYPGNILLIWKKMYPPTYVGIVFNLA